MAGPRMRPDQGSHVEQISSTPPCLWAAVFPFLLEMGVQMTGNFYECSRVWKRHCYLREFIQITPPSHDSNFTKGSIPVDTSAVARFKTLKFWPHQAKDTLLFNCYHCYKRFIYILLEFLAEEKETGLYKQSFRRRPKIHCSFSSTITTRLFESCCLVGQAKSLQRAH